MPYFFFHFRDVGCLIEDPEGTDLPDVESARAEALATAREILADRVKRAKVVDTEYFAIADETGTIVATVLLKEALNRPLGDPA